ncbi:hypothetical protein D3C87_1855070 [compost metagenome]
MPTRLNMGDCLDHPTPMAVTAASTLDLHENGRWLPAMGRIVDDPAVRPGTIRRQIPDRAALSFEVRRDGFGLDLNAVRCLRHLRRLDPWKV